MCALDSVYIWLGLCPLWLLWWCIVLGLKCKILQMIAQLRCCVKHKQYEWNSWADWSEVLSSVDYYSSAPWQEWGGPKGAPGGKECVSACPSSRPCTSNMFVFPQLSVVCGLSCRVERASTSRVIHSIRTSQWNELQYKPGMWFKIWVKCWIFTWHQFAVCTGMCKWLGLYLHLFDLHSLSDARGDVFVVNIWVMKGSKAGWARKT